MKINGKNYYRTTYCSENADDAFDRIIVHAGRFHADDVFCVAMTLLCCPNAEVLRVMSVPEEYMDDKRSIVADIGFGKYDHHQPDAEVREDGSKYAACGLLYKDIKDKLFNGNHLAEEVFEKRYIIPVEIADNGGVENPLSNAVSSFNPAWDSGRSNDEAFADAVEFVQAIIKRELCQSRSEEKAADRVRDALEKSDGVVVELPTFMPWKNQLIESTAVYVIYKSNRGGYNVQAVPAKYGDKTAKKDLPKEWVTNKPEGCTFLHNSLFLACFETKDQAARAAHSALQY